MSRKQTPSRSRLRKRPVSHRDSSKEGRRRKRLTKRNGDRQYFAAVKKLRRRKIDEWQMANNPKRFRRRAVQLAAQAEKRQMKQEARDKAKQDALA